MFDKLLELQAATAKPADFNGTGVEIPVRFLPVCDWVVAVSSWTEGASSGADFYLEVSDAVGGTYHKIAQLHWPTDQVSGVAHVPMSGDMSVLQDADSAFLRVRYDLLSASGTMVYASWLDTAHQKHGIAARPGDVVAFA